MGKLYVSIKPFGDDAGAAYAADFVDVTNDVVAKGISKLKQSLDNNEFDIGIFRHGNFDLSLINQSGKYSDVDQTSSTIFKYTRSNSIVRLHWSAQSEDYQLGIHAPCGYWPCAPKVLIGDFLLNDESLTGKAGDQVVKFKCLSRTVLIEQVEVPYSTIANGNLLSVVLFKILNQAPITDHLTVLQANIVTGVDFAIDDRTLGDLENEKGITAIKKLLLFSSSVLRINSSGAIIVSARTASAALMYTFRGPSSLNGQENILEISGYRSGVNRVKNLVKVTDTTALSRIQTSIDKYGVKEKSIQFKPVTTTANRETACAFITTEFDTPKKELILETPMDYDRLDLILLDRIKIDYPSRTIQNDNTAFYDSGHDYDSGKIYAEEILDIDIDPEIRWKVLSVEHDFQNETMFFELRQIA